MDDPGEPMKLARMAKFFLAAIGLAASVAQANNSNQFATFDPNAVFGPDVSSYSGSQGAFIANPPTASLSKRDNLFRLMLATNQKDLDYPAFPRTWFEQAHTDYYDSNTAMGLNIGYVGGGISIDYKWSMKSTLVIVAASHDESEAVDANQVSISGVSLGEAFRLGIFKPLYPKTHVSLPNVSKQYPMVAFCAFETSLTDTHSKKAGVNFMGNGESLEKGSSDAVVESFFSKTFQVDGTMSPMQMLHELCIGKFSAAVKKSVLKDFANPVIEMTAYYSPLNECQPDSKDGAAGDAGCMGWFQKNFDTVIQKITVPRCVYQNNGGVHRCQLRSKANGECSMYWDAKKSAMVSPEQAAASGVFMKATGGNYEFGCDDGLVCVPQNQPWVLGGFPVWTASAKCLRK